MSTNPNSNSLLTRYTQAQWYAIGNLELLVCGQDFFPRLIKEIDSATQTVRLETYIFANDLAGQQVMQALRFAVQRGVRVQLITDWVGSPKTTWFAQAIADGIEHRIFNPSYLSWRLGISRTHRKLAVIDSTIAFVGGINLINDFNNGHDDQLAKPLPAPRWDFAVRLTGTVVAEVEHALELQWQRLSHPISEKIQQTKEFLSWLTEETLHSTSKNGSKENVPTNAFIARDNLRHRRTIEKAYLQAIGRARKEVLLANPYFVPGRRLRRALLLAAQRGVHVTLLLGRKEFWMLDRAVPAMYGALLDAGVRIAEYDKTLLHGKVAVVDGVWATVGSSNCDALSFVLNHEANIVVQNHPMVQQLKAEIEKAVKEEARIIEPHVFANRSWSARFGSWCAYVTYRTMMRLITIGRYQ